MWAHHFFICMAVPHCLYYANWCQFLLCVLFSVYKWSYTTGTLF